MLGWGFLHTINVFSVPYFPIVGIFCLSVFFPPSFLLFKKFAMLFRVITRPMFFSCGLPILASKSVLVWFSHCHPIMATLWLRGSQHVHSHLSNDVGVFFCGCLSPLLSFRGVGC